MAAVPVSIVVWLSIFAAASEKPLPTVEITGNTFFSSLYLTAGGGEIKTPDDAEILIHSILKKYTDAGFAFCRVYPETYRAERGFQRIVLKIEEGERITITDCVFITKGRTDAGPLQRIARFKVKKYFSTKDVMRAKKAIMKTGAFARVAEKIVKYEDGYYLVFELVENKNDYLSGAGSFAQENFDYSVILYSINIFGTMRKIQCAYESNFAPTTARHKKLFLIDFTEPVILAPVSLNALLRIATHDTAQLTELKGQFNAPLNEYMNTSLLTGIEAVSYVADSIQTSNTNTVLGIGFDLDHTTVNWTIDQRLEIDHLFRAHDRTRIRYDGAIAFKGLYVRPHFWRVDTKQFDYFDYFRLGGAKNIRGYLEEEFVTAQAYWINFEYKRYPVFPLVDLCRLESRPGYLLSYGFGIDAKTSIANAALIFAWPKNGTWYDGKVHFILEKSL